MSLTRQFTQNKALFEGMSQHMWHYYTAVIMWKSQSPWPSLRGALYDSYLETSGGFWGVRRALTNGLSGRSNASSDASPFRSSSELEPENDSRENELQGLHVQLDLSTLHLVLLNKGPGTLELSESIAVESVLLDLATSQELLHLAWPPARDVTHPSTLAPGEVIVSDEALPWPENEGRTVFLQHRLLRGNEESGAREILAANYYWLNDGAVPGQNYSDLGALVRSSPKLNVTATGSLTISDLGSGSGKDVSLSLRMKHDDPAGAAPVAIWTQLTLEVSPFDDDGNDRRVLPTWWSDNGFTLVPGEERTVHATIPLHALISKSAALDDCELRVLIDGWHVQPFVLELGSCTPQAQTLPVMQ